MRDDPLEASGRSGHLYQQLERVGTELRRRDHLQSVVRGGRSDSVLLRLVPCMLSAQGASAHLCSGSSEGRLRTLALHCERESCHALAIFDIAECSMEIELHLILPLGLIEGTAQFVPSFVALHTVNTQA